MFDNRARREIMRRMRERLVVAGVAGLVAVILAACVGDDAGSAAGGTIDAGTNPPSGSDGGGTLPPPPADASEPTCVGETFEAPVPISVSGTDAGTDEISDVRVVGTRAYFAKRPAGVDTVAKLFTAVWRPPADGGPGLEGASSFLFNGASESDRHPAMAPDLSFMLFTHGEEGTQNMWTASADSANAGFTHTSNGAASEFLMGGDGNDIQPWLAGNFPRAVYWAHGDGNGSALRIARITVERRTDGISYGEPKALGSPCPLVDALDNCGSPVVDDVESSLLFAAWPKSAFAPKIYEVALGRDEEGNVVPSQQLIEHPELGERAVSWISGDGCEVIVGRTKTADLRYARRAKR